MKRSIEKTTGEARSFFAKRNASTTLCISAGELKSFIDRLEGDHPIEVLYDLWLFGFAIGHRAGIREKA